MTPALDGWAVLLAATLAVLTFLTTMRATERLTAARSWSAALVCRVTIASLAVGAGLWCANLTALLAVGAVQPMVLRAAPAFLALPVSIVGMAGALSVLAGREASGPRWIGSGAVLAATICVTFILGAAWSGGRDLFEGSLTSLSAFMATTFLTCIAGSWLYFSSRGSPPIRAHTAAGIAALLAGSGVMLMHAGAILRGPWLFSPWCECEQMAATTSMAAALAAGGFAIIAVTQVIAVCDGRLALRVGRFAREIEELHTRLEYLATHDSLTGLPNWTSFKERLAQAVADTERPGRGIAVAVLDLDRFSSLNHSLGHGAGDWLLTEVARRVSSVIRPESMLARLGSDEFVVLIDSVAARVEAQAVTKAILAALHKPMSVHGNEIHVCPSIGVSVWPDDGRRVDDLLAHAEVAMGVAKSHGGNEVQFFRRDMTDSMTERLALENDLRRALSAGEFELWFQPELCARSGRILAVEALVRWRHPDLGIIEPNSFIPLAEETGLIIPLGEWVVREVCRQGRAWQLAGGAGFRLAMNLSATQFRHQRLIEVIRAALEAEGLPATCLEIELTESAVMTNPEESVSVLRLLRKMGVTVAIDDFGTGYSSLSHLRRFPIDKLKIDRSFVRDLATSRTDESIVRAIIALAHSVGLQVVAEGVETEEHLRCVQALGCDLWQGYYCCEPRPAALFAQVLAAGDPTSPHIRARG